MESLLKHWPRILVTLLPLVVVLLHSVGAVNIGFIQRLDDIIYDARLRATMTGTLDERIVIVDIDEKSLAEVGRWPWGRNRMAELTRELFDVQNVALLGYDIVFAEADESSGLRRLTELAKNELKGEPGFVEKLLSLQGLLDYDAAFARSIEKRPVVLGFYFTSDRDGLSSGVLPAPVISSEALQGHAGQFTSWNGYGSNLALVANAAPLAGFFNSITGSDGVVRSLPLIAEYKGQYYESLALAMFRVLIGLPTVAPGFPAGHTTGQSNQRLENILLKLDERKIYAIPVDDRATTLVPYRGFGGPQGGAFKYVSAVDVLAKRLPVGALKNKIVLVGTTAPGLADLRVTPVGEAYPGVETHANVISGLLDGKMLVRPDYAVGYDVLLLVVSGLGLAIGLPLLNASRAVMLSAGVLTLIFALNFWMYRSFGLVLPLAGAVAMATLAYGLNMSYGYFVESRSKRKLANLFGIYVPPELVDEMVKDPDSYTMKASNKELTVMFSDMRGFTKMAELMEPVQLQVMLNDVFSRLTGHIRTHRGTIDKYMGDCVMAFWGAPVETADHAKLAVTAAMEMSRAIQEINQVNRAKGIPQIGIGIGLNTGNMCVGDMGSNIRRSYTVIGDAVNLGARLEGLSKYYGVDIVVGESTRDRAPEFAWQELDKVRVRGKDRAVAIYCPLAVGANVLPDMVEELKTWAAFLQAYRGQDWDQSDVHLINLSRGNAKKYLYQLYADRVASMRILPFDPEWDGATNFETK